MELTLLPETRLEFALARLKPGQDDVLFGQYFPKAGPLVAEYGGKSLGSFQVVSSNLEDSPAFGALFSWPSGDVFDKFHEDERYKAIEPLRSQSLDFLTNGHFFKAPALDLPLSADQDYLLAVLEKMPGGLTQLFDLPFASDSRNAAYTGNRLVLAEWPEATENLAAPVRCRIRFNT